MPNHRLVFWGGLLMLLGVGALTPVAAEDGNVQVQAVLIHASNEKGLPTNAFAGIEPQLRKVLGFARYRHFGEGNARIDLPGSGTIRLGRGYTLQIEASQAARGRIRLQVNWRKGDQGLMSTSTVVSRGGAPAILGGPSHEEGKLIVTLAVQ